MSEGANTREEGFNEEFYRQRRGILFPAAYGINHSVHKELTDLFEEELHHSSFYFYEYFLDSPITRQDSIGWEDGESRLFAPFLARLAYKTGFMPAVNRAMVDRWMTDPEHQIDSVPLTSDNKKEYWKDFQNTSMPVSDSIITKGLLQQWLGKTSPEFNVEPVDTKAQWISEPPPESPARVVLIQTYPTSHLKHGYLEQIKARGHLNRYETLQCLLREYDLVIRPWLRNQTLDCINFLSASISSNSIFWGAVFIVFAHWQSSDPKFTEKRKAFAGALKKQLGEQIKRLYLPMLGLTENYVYEDLTKRQLSSSKRKAAQKDSLPGPLLDLPLDKFQPVADQLKRIGSRKSITEAATLYEGQELAGHVPRMRHVFLRLLFQKKLRLGSADSSSQAGQSGDSQLEQLEESLVELWADRLSILLRDPKSGKEKLQKSLVFTKYLVASPKMVDCAMQAIRQQHTQGNEPCSVKSALVVGGPGSGKDSMARLIQLFSPGYRFGRVIVFNMAMFRPKEAAVPLLFGLEASRKEPAQNSPWLSIRGVLERAISEPDKDETSEEEDKDSAEEKRQNEERGVTLILDELNSLDIDTQGALLRLLENAELRRLGGIDSSLERMDLLIIGVMNEDPHLIMKRQTIDRVLREQLFGGILGESLYEFFRNQRRLRDDLYYRLIRGGEIRLPELQDRREDIPILFFFYLKTECGLLNPCADKHWNVELSVYEELMSERLSWEGNLRELQTATRNIVIAALEDPDKSANKSEVNIRGYHAHKVLEMKKKKP